MKKIRIIIKREYLSRVRKRSFIVMTLLGPLLMAAMFVVPAYMATRSDSVKTIAVIDVKGIFYKSLKETESMKFVYPPVNVDSAKKQTEQGIYDGVLYLPADFNANPSSAQLFYEKQLGIHDLSYLENSLTQVIIKFQADRCLDNDIQKYFENNIKIATLKIKGDGEKEESSNTGVSTFLGIFCGIMIYMFVFMFGTQVLRGVIEEKTSRIIEVIISSVKPFQLMMGKIIGIALVGLTQFLLWIILTFGIVTIAMNVISTDNHVTKKEIAVDNNKILNQQQLEQNMKADQYKNPEMNEMLSGLLKINYGLMISMFLFYFLFGYLLYAALFAAVGSAVDSESDTQQFMLPITIPLIFSIVMSQFVINNPECPVAFWLSIIPLTSPIIMMVRIPFGVPVIDIIISCTLLIAGFLLCTWMAAKIYRTGILMYGKKASYRELIKWLTYKS